MIEERIRKAPSGVLALLVLLLLFALDVYLLIRGIVDGTVWLILVASLLIPILLILSAGLFTVAPNEARVLQLFGSYVGTVRNTGLRYANPLYSKRRISVRVRNFETERSKVNDTDGNPIEMAAVVVWKVADTAEASFEVDDYVNFVHVQSESAVRNLATRYPYDTQEEGQTSLRGDTEEIADQLKTEIQGRLGKAGVEVLEARITHLAYAPEIASAMLQRQQAGAIIAARSQIVEGAVSMVEMALEGLSTRGIVELDEERKANMVSNLLVVLCGDKATQPVLNTDTL
ncbi:MAG: SPFH domain-containing protein [Acidimicrobiia bacterium]|nr:SPFH domain-containing protein [Acidimicrobiia bacterium]MYF84039.1 SPFH domain-containing protein [Acidimicrobiia bacterium]